MNFCYIWQTHISKLPNEPFLSLMSCRVYWHEGICLINIPLSHVQYIWGIPLCLHFMFVSDKIPILHKQDVENCITIFEAFFAISGYFPLMEI
jgi:hypothetical protein